MPSANVVWQSFVAVASWPSPGPARHSFGHVRSISSITRSTTSSPLSHSIRPPSASDVPSPTADALAFARPSTPQPRIHRPSHSHSHSHSQSYTLDYDLSTIPDPRSRGMSPASGPSSTPTRHPDLNDEVATLSTKLINAINHQTTLDDNLSSTRLELAQSHQKIHELEDQLAQQREMLSGDVWVRRKNVEAEKFQLTSRVADEKRQRQEAEQQKKKIELELENLTAALFEEANKMVISAKEDARREHEALQRKNDQLRAQLADTESLLKSQQDQLSELKRVMEQMDGDRDDQTAQTVPSSPGFSKFDPREDDAPPPDAVSQSAFASPLSPSNPTSFSHLLQPILRTDLPSYNDFLDLVRTSKRHSAHRVSSGSHSGFAALGLGLGSSSANSPSRSSSTASTPAQSSPQTPNTPASAISTGPSASAAHLPPLKDTKFYKRALAEDIEPTLRLDIAPGLSWLARRTVLNSVTDGSLVVEPVPTNTFMANIAKPQFYSCSLCGESRNEDEYLRTHRFRTNESDSAQRYPLCKYCLGRVRSACDFLGFLRIVKDGHWRADDEDAEKAAWEESVRLREQMFWSRIGGGVIPTTTSLAHSSSRSTASPSLSEGKSPRPSHEEPVRAGDAGDTVDAVEEAKLRRNSIPEEASDALPRLALTEAHGPSPSSLITQGESLNNNTHKHAFPLPPEISPPTPDEPVAPTSSNSGDQRGDALSFTDSSPNDA